MASIRENLAEVRARIGRAAGRAGRSPDSVRLLVVTKTQPPERIRDAYEAGARMFGENIVQEFEGKRPLLELPGAQWHLVGHLQSNKARRAAELFDVVQTVDTVRLARRLDAAAAGRAPGRALPVLIEIKLSPEPAKAGCPEDQVPDLARELAGLSNLRLAGVMTVPPYSEDPEDVRPYFRRLREWRDRLGLIELSMGMTHDFEVAVEEGASIVRIGTAIFGGRGQGPGPGVNYSMTQ